MSPDLQQEIQRRLAKGPFKTEDELISQALRALDHSRTAAQELIEIELLKGFEGEDVDLSVAEWESIEQEALAILEAKKNK
jgi:Arc/MetJ-type ribon-helix-helix transcriptional regulator